MAKAETAKASKRAAATPRGRGKYASQVTSTRY